MCWYIDRESKVQHCTCEKWHQKTVKNDKSGLSQCEEVQRNYSKIAATIFFYDTFKDIWSQRHTLTSFYRAQSEAHLEDAHIVFQQGLASRLFL